MTPLAKRDFIGPDENTWLFTGAESPLHRGVLKAVEEYLRNRSNGPRGREFNAQMEASCRARFAELLGGKTEEIAFLSNSSEAIVAILLALRLAPGDNIVVNNLEFPSAILGSLALQEMGIEVRIVSHRNWQVSEEEVLAHVDEKTRLIIASHVSYLSGARFDYKQLYRQLQETSTLLLLDATQSLGVAAVEMKHADFVVCSSYKWLLGIHGAGVLAINPTRTGDMVPLTAGWRSVENLFSPLRFEKVERYEDARRFELGFPSFPTLAALNHSTGVLQEADIERIETHVLQLGHRLLEGLDKLEVEVMTPRKPEKRAGNIAFVCAQGEQFAQDLLEAGVMAWGGDGRLRLSIHGFNDEADINHALREIERLQSRQ